MAVWLKPPAYRERPPPTATSEPVRLCVTGQSSPKALSSESPKSWRVTQILQPTLFSMLSELLSQHSSNYNSCIFTGDREHRSVATNANQSPDYAILRAHACSTMRVIVRKPLIFSQINSLSCSTLPLFEQQGQQRAQAGVPRRPGGWRWKSSILDLD